MRSLRPVLTAHLHTRLGDRAQLQVSELLEILARNAVAKIYCTRSRSHLAHILFWSPPDNGHLIAIQDVVTGHVLTVLTEAMYEAWYPGVITDKQRSKVRMRADDLHTEKLGRARQFPCGISAKLAGKRHPIQVGRWSKSSSDGHVVSLGEQWSFWTWVIDQLEKLNVPIWELEGIVANLPSGEHVEVRYAC